MFTRPLWAEVSRARLLANYEKLRVAAGSEAELMPVVKANAYGHDVLACAPWLAGAGARWLGVTGAEEGAAVRAVCAETAHSAHVWGLCRGSRDVYRPGGLRRWFGSPGSLTCWRQRRRRGGFRPGASRFTWEIDTGMSRQGVRVVGLKSRRKQRCYCGVFILAPACGWKV